MRRAPVWGAWSYLRWGILMGGVGDDAAKRGIMSKFHANANGATTFGVVSKYHTYYC